MAKVKGPSIREFQKRFPDEDTCLKHLMRVRFGDRLKCFKCQKQATYYRVKARRSFECEHCGYQVYPTAGTPFEKTRTSLRDWFYVMFLFCETRNGVAAIKARHHADSGLRQGSGHTPQIVRRHMHVAVGEHERFVLRMREREAQVFAHALR